MSKELYESKVAKDAAKRFRMLCEYSFDMLISRLTAFYYLRLKQLY